MGLGTAVAYLTLDATGFATGIDMAMADAQRLNTGFNNVSNSVTDVGKKMVGAGKVLTAGITAPIIGFGAASIKSGSEFDKSMSDVRAVSMNTKTDMDALSKAAEELGVSYSKGTSDADTAFNALRSTAIKMGNDTKFTAKESADALYYMGLAGWSADEMISGIPGILSLASAGNVELATTSDIVTDAITGFGHSADEMVKVIRGGFNNEIPVATRLADIMAATMANSNTDVDMLGQAFKYVSPIAGSFGYSMEDVSLALGLMANAGIKATQGGTTLRQGLKRLIAPTDKAAAAMEKYNFSAVDAQGNVKPLRQQLDELRGIFGQLDIDVTNADGSLKSSEQIMKEYGKSLPITEQEKLKDAVDVFGTTALPGMLALMNASQDSFDDLSSAIDNSSAAFVLHNGEVMTYKDAIKQYGEELVTTSDAFEVLGSSEGMAQVQLDNLQGDWTLFKSALGTTKQIISDMASGPLRELVQGLTDLVRKFNEMDPEQQKMIVKFALIAASIGPVFMVLGKLVTMIGKFRGAIGLLKDAGKAASGMLGKLATGAFNVSEGFKLARFGLPDLAKDTSLLGAKLGGVASAFSEASSVAGGGFLGAIKGAGAAIGTFFTPVTIVIAVIALLVGAFVHLMRTNDEFRDKVVGKFKDLWDNLQGYFQQIVDAVNSLGFNFKDIADLIAGAWDGLCNLLAPILQGIITLITTNIDAIIQEITGFIQIFSGIIGVIKGIISGDEEQIRESVDVFLDGILNLLEGFAKVALAPILGIFDIINEIFGTNLPTTFEGFKSAVDDVVSAIGEKIDAIVNFIKSIPDRIMEFFSSVGQFFTDLWDTIVTTLTEINTAIEDWASSVVKWFKELPGSIVDFINQVGESIGEFVSDLISKAQDIGTKFVQAVVDFFNELPYTIGYIIGYVITSVAKFVVDLAKSAKEIGTKFIDVVVKFFKELPGKVVKFLTDTYNKTSKWVIDMITKAKEVGKNFIDNVVNFFTQLPGKIKRFFEDIIISTYAWTTNMVNKAKEVGSKFVDNVVNFFKQLPGKILGFFMSIIANTITWTVNMINKAKEVGTNFVNSIVNFFKQLPGKVLSFLKNTINNVVKFANDMKNKAIQAGQWFMDNIVKKVSEIPSKMLSIGKNIVEGVWNGIKSVGDWLITQVGNFFSGIVDGAKAALGIHSPSTVFEKQVGLNIVLGTAKGIKENSKYAENAISYVMDKVIKVTGKAYDEQYKIASNGVQKIQKQLDKVNKQITNATSDEEKKRLKEQRNNLKEQLKNQKQALKDLQNDYLSYSETQLSQQQKLYTISRKEVVEYWKDVRSHLDKGTSAYREATKKIIEAQIDMYANLVSDAQTSLDKMKQDRDVSLSEQVTYWQNIREQCIVGSTAYEDATDKIKSAQKELDDSISEANETLQSGMNTVTESVKANIDDIEKSYTDAIKSIKETLMGVTSLFEEFSVDEAVSSDDLVNNLDSQVQSLEDWNATLDKMFARGLPQDLIESLQSMGPKSMASINNLLDMTDEELNRYIELWNKKSEEAAKAAAKMVDRTSYDEQIKTAIADGQKQVEELVNTYNLTMEKLGVTTSDSAQLASLTFTNQFVTKLQKDLPDADFSFVKNAIDSKYGKAAGNKMANDTTTSYKNSFVKAFDGMQSTIANSANNIITTVNKGVAATKVNVSGYIDLGRKIINNIITGVNSRVSAFTSKINSIAIKGMNSFITGIKSMEQDVYRQGEYIGYQLMNGLEEGIHSHIIDVVNATIAALQEAEEAAEDYAEIGSPSRLFERKIGKWLPLGIAKGFVNSIPTATNEMQKALNDGIDSLNADEISIFPNVKNIGDEVRDAFSDVSDWFSGVTKTVTDMTDTMKENIQDVVDITNGMLYNVYEGGSDNLNKLISGRNVTAAPIVTQVEEKDGKQDQSTNNTFIFNSPKPINEVEAARLLRQTSRNLAEGFV